MTSSQGKNRVPIICVMAVIFTVSGWATGGNFAAADDALACTDCHTEQQEAEFVHNPALEGFCEACHEASPKHLEEGGPGGMKTDRTAAACYQCHEEKDDGENVHPALMMEGECVQCHNPHGSDNRGFLVQPKSGLCFECHDPVPAEAAEGSDHRVVSDEQSCMNCHHPHSSDQDSLLLASQKTLCLGCHGAEIAAEGEEDPVRDIQHRMEMSSVHEPATWEGGCTSCHLPHGSAYGNLLAGAFPVENYVEYKPGDGDPGTYALCFNCHDPAMLNEKIEAGDTGFRDDSVRDGQVVRQNLHWYHVVDAAGSGDETRGRSCSICHDAHGAPQPHLINARWTMRSFRPTLEFESLPDGGACLMSCHALKKYRRME